MAKDPLRALGIRLAHLAQTQLPERLMLRVSADLTAFGKLSRILANIPERDCREAAEILERYVVSQRLPAGDPKREAWEIIGDLTPRMATKFWRHLPDPRTRRGRRKGSGLAKEIELAVSAGEEEAAVVARLIREATGDQKHRRDYLRRLRKSGKK